MKSAKYLKWVASLECSICGAPADDSHHIKGVGHFSGIGRKAPDFMVMPLCRAHHNEIHANHDLWPKQWEYLVRTLYRAFEDGKIGFK